MPSNTILYVFRNRLLNNIASTIFRNLGSFPGSSGSTSLPSPAVVRTMPLSNQGTSVVAVAWSAKRKTSRSHGVSPMAAVVHGMTTGGMHREMSKLDSHDVSDQVPRARVIYAGRIRYMCAQINFLVDIPRHARLHVGATIIGCNAYTIHSAVSRLRSSFKSHDT